MIRNRIHTSLFLAAGAMLVAASTQATGCSSDDTSKTGDEANITDGMDDPFALLILDGGCTVIDAAGRDFQTAGDGGACPKTVTGVLDRLKEKTGQDPNAFVVSERADQPSPDQAYRFVLSQATELGGPEKLLLSVADFGGGFSETFIEVMAWSEKKQAFNFYRMTGQGWQLIGDGSMASPGGGAAFECMNCHTSGAPLMKELQDGWNNWESTWFSTPDPGKDNEAFNRVFNLVKRADDLEDHVVAGTKLHVAGYVDRALEGGQLKGLLRHVMCDEAEPALISTHSKNSQRFGEVKAPSFMFFPPSILGSQLLKTPRTGSGKQGGYDNVVNMNIPAFDSLKFSGDAYSAGVAAIGQHINGEPGDAVFGLFTPERSYVDNQVAEELVRRGILDKDILADLLMTEFTVPVFSTMRCALADTAPNEGSNPEEIRTAWAANLQGSALPGAAALAGRLSNPEDLSEHETRANAFFQACIARNDADANAYALDILKIISQRRKEFTELYHNVVESPDLLPGDALTDANPHQWRLHPETCMLQPQSEGFPEPVAGGGTGGTGGMGGAGGGGGGGGGMCAHDECVAGVALDPSCSACAAAVCAADSFCCDNEWDAMCVGTAGNEAACNCN